MSNESSGFLSRIGSVFKKKQVRQMKITNALPTVESKIDKFNVTSQSVLRVHSALACINAISDNIAALRPDVIAQREISEGVFIPERLDPLTNARARIIGEFWNENTTAERGLHYMMRQYLTTGVAYALIQRNLNGTLASITPLPTDTGYVRTVDGGYAIARNGGKIIIVNGDLDLKFIPFSNMISIRYDSNPDHKATPEGPVQLGRDTIALAHAVQERISQYFINGAPAYLLTSTFTGDEETDARMVKNIKEAQKSMADEGFNFGIIPGETDVKMIGNTAEHAQMNALWISSTQAVARLFDVPPSVIGENSRSTFSNAEQQQSAFLRGTLQPILHKLEQEFNLKIFGQQQNSTDRVKFNTADFERTDVKAARELMIKEVQVGIRTRNEARAENGLPYSEQEGADDLMAQMQDVAIGDEEQEEPTQEPDNEEIQENPDDEQDSGSQGSE